MTEPKESFFIGQRLKFARSQSGLSQAQVAVFMDIPRPSISNIESGKRKVTSEEISKFAELYDVSSSWLLTEKTEIQDAAVQFAARELSKLKKEDFDTILSLLKTFRSRRSD